VKHPAGENSLMKKRGFVYAVSHDAWLQETVRSGLSAREAMPDLERELYITENLFAPNRGVLEDAFTKVFPIRSSFRHRPRFDSCLMTTLDQPIFIDGDTLVLEPVYEVFEVLDDFDVALCLDPQLHHPIAVGMNLHSSLPFVSMAVPEFNSGLIVANNTDKFRSFIKLWMELFQICMDKHYTMDQVALRVALVKSGLRVATLPNNYNFRANIVQSAAKVVKILHCHGELEEIAKIINQRTTIRGYQPGNFIHGSKLDKARREEAERQRAAAAAQEV
jgi:hypothetical protein